MTLPWETRRKDRRHYDRRHIEEEGEKKEESWIPFLIFADIIFVIFLINKLNNALS